MEMIGLMEEEIYSKDRTKEPIPWLISKLTLDTITSAKCEYLKTWVPQFVMLFNFATRIKTITTAEKQGLETRLTTITTEKQEMETRLTAITTEKQEMETRLTTITTEKQEMGTRLTAITTEKEAVEIRLRGIVIAVSSVYLTYQDFETRKGDARPPSL